MSIENRERFYKASFEEGLRPTALTPLENSSNTKELLAACKKIGVEAYMIQSAGQLEKEWFEGKEKVGVTAGASTPDITINEVVERIKEIGKENIRL